MHRRECDPPLFFFCPWRNRSVPARTYLTSSSTGWSKASLSADASEENDGYSSGEEPLNSDPEDESGRKLVSSRGLSPRLLRRAQGLKRLSGTPQAPGKYTVVADCERAGPQELSVRSGDVVQLIREAEEGQW